MGTCEWDDEAGIALGKKMGDQLKAEAGEGFFDGLLENGGGW